jgi:hypothetical protein
MRDTRAIGSATAIAALCLRLATTAGAARAIEPIPIRIGGEFQINSYSTAGGVRPAVATDANGDFVVVWERYLSDPRR